jgi:7-cyano-7-deazaguanine synthase in queuosine biosynthesis
MKESVRNSVNRAMGRPVEEAPKSESMRDSIVKAMGELNEALGNAMQPYTKEEVNYRDGDVRERCGKCEHFQVLKEHGCELVQGHIEAQKMCDKYDPDDEYA